MQKNVPKYTPDWVETVTWWAETSKRDVRYALCNDRRTLLWFANQRAIEYHPALVTVDRPDRMTHLVLDLDPPEGDGFAASSRSRTSCARRSTTLGLAGALKTSGAKGVHVFVPIDRTPRRRGRRPPRRARSPRAPNALDPSIATTAFVKDDREGKVFVDATRVGGATVVAAYSPRLRPGVPVSFPLGVGRARRRSRRPTSPSTPRSTRSATATRGPSTCPNRSTSRDDLVAEGHEIPVAARAGDARGQAPQARPSELTLERAREKTAPNRAIVPECREPSLKRWPSPSPAS